MKVVAGKLALGTADIWVPNDGMPIAPPQRLCRFLVAWWVLGRDEERGTAGLIQDHVPGVAALRTVVSAFKL